MKFKIRKSRLDGYWHKGKNYDCYVCHIEYVDSFTHPAYFIQQTDIENIPITGFEVLACSDECVNFYILQHA